MDEGMADVHEGNAGVRETRSSHKFRFKRSKDGSRTTVTEDVGEKEHDRHRHHRHHHRRKRRKLPSDSDGIPKNNVSNMPQDQAFQESLFDALADDEGAAFWESVYGQPIHNFPNTFVDPDTGNVGTMNEEEYAQYVRQRMWEKSAEGVEAARRRRQREQKQEDEARARQARETRDQSSRSRRRDEDDGGAPYNNYHFDFELEASLRRGERRKERRHWQTLWKDYMTRWEKLYCVFEQQRDVAPDTTEQVPLRDSIAWPVESGQLNDVNGPNIHRFMNRAIAALSESDISVDRTALIKVERVRWHPDKIQQRYGFMSIDASTMEGVTAVFQVLDQMLTDLRKAS